jgi:murein L,D-transpeptidase YcbB/YkuD
MVIAVEDLLPRQVEDPAFLDRHRIRVYRGTDPAAIDPARVDWQRLGPGRFPYRLVQEAGPGNSLGRIKLSFQNPYDIYLHDTPAKGMFGLGTRSLSSGCVRLEDAAALATLAVANDRAWDDAATQAAVAAGKTRTINLGHTIPVYIVYMTVWSGGDGELPESSLGFSER